MQSFGVIVKERTKMKIIEKKEWKTRSNFKWTFKKLQLKMDIFFTRDNVLQLWQKQQQLEIIKDVHEGFTQSTYSEVMASHKDRDSTYLNIYERFFQYLIYKDVKFCQC